MDKRLKYKLPYGSISYDAIKILEENTGSKVSDISCRHIFANISPMAREIKENINKWDYIKIKSFCTVKGTIIKMKRGLTVWENMFATIYRTRV